ncbi:cytokinin dehydrogenase 5-like [Canna indica]|uniref:Cytokinin dehydrogenase 5-like n=1 Tax=Canna indica TaxID=4628 RepID=A0AAQ3K3J2_9LILI|nr:cytokinin dehydrogenase 5-like [Canna indica]
MNLPTGSWLNTSTCSAYDFTTHPHCFVRFKKPSLPDRGHLARDAQERPRSPFMDEFPTLYGKGEIMTCSREENSDLFNEVLGGLS